MRGRSNGSSFLNRRGFCSTDHPGCGKTLIGQAAAGSLAKRLSESQQGLTPDKDKRPPVTSGAFLHVKGPEILNMWLGESERMVRDLFEQARARRKEGALPFIFIDEAESILGTRRAMRSFNISNTLVPMFCSEMDGIESLRDVVIILASNRPDLIDPAVLRPGRIDRKIKVSRPNTAAAAEILNVYLTADLPLDPTLVKDRGGEPVQAVVALVEDIIEAIFRRTEETRLLSIRLEKWSEYGAVPRRSCQWGNLGVDRSTGEGKGDRSYGSVRAAGGIAGGGSPGSRVRGVSRG
ncbi:MAG: AAA family ATPase [Nitrospira sp.]|nr:AAA family ATPase [Nitrospira sp.]